MNTFFLRRLFSDVPMMNAETLIHIIGNEPSALQIQAAEHPMFARHKEAMRPKIEMNGDIAIVPVQGALAYNPDVWEMMFDGVEDSRSVLNMVHDARKNADVKGVLLRIDTPGGMMMGGPEIGDAVALTSKQKPIIAHIGGQGTSLGYLIASQADEVVANRSAVTGSIGVIAAIADWSGFLAQKGIKQEYFTNAAAKYKAAGAPGTSMSMEHRTHIQNRIENAFTVFRDAVKSKRPQVKDEAMQGQTFYGSEAKSVGLVDRVGDEEFALGVLRAKMQRA